MDKFIYFEIRDDGYSTFEQVGKTLYDDFLIYKSGKFFGLIDENFNKIIEPEYEEICVAYKFHFWGKRNSIWQLYDFNNLKKINKEFAEVSAFNNGFACVSLNGKTFGFINKFGEFVISPIYQKGIHLGSNLFVVSKRISQNSENLKYGVIDKNENIVFPFTLDTIPSFTGIVHFVIKQRKPLKEWLRL